MTDNAIVPFASYDETERVAKAMVASGFFKDVQQTSQAIVKILAGRELGFGPFASLTGVNVIQNKPVIGANLLASAIKATRKYNYRILEMTDKACEIEFFEDGKPVGKSRFTMEDAQKAGLETKDNWRKYPRNMLFARAISNGQKWYCPDACNGVTVYTPDEMGATVDEDGQVVNLPPVKIIEPPAGNGHNPNPPEPEPIPAEHDTAVLPIVSLEMANAMTTSEGVAYGAMSLATIKAVKRGIEKALTAPDLTQERREELQLKLACAKVVIDAAPK